MTWATINICASAVHKIYSVIASYSIENFTLCSAEQAIILVLTTARSCMTSVVCLVQELRRLFATHGTVRECRWVTLLILRALSKMLVCKKHHIASTARRSSRQAGCGHEYLCMQDISCKYSGSGRCMCPGADGLCRPGCSRSSGRQLLGSMHRRWHSHPPHPCALC